MPKRSCPFELNYAPQLKIHISDKEVSKVKRKSIENAWNRTKELLLSGARKQFSKDTIDSSVEYKCDFCLNANLTDIYDCVTCNKSFCSKCCLNVYRNDVTETICLSCTK